MEPNHNHHIPTAAPNDPRTFWREAFRRVRAETERRAAPLSAEDQVVQPMADASPTKWHLAHTTWFFEQFVLEPHLAGYRTLDERFAYCSIPTTWQRARDTRARNAG